MAENPDELDETDHWPSVSDLFMSLFIVALVMVATLFYVTKPKSRSLPDRAVLEAVGLDLKKIREPVNELRVALDEVEIRSSQSPGEVVAALRSSVDLAVDRLQLLKKDLAAAKAELNDKPPIIQITEKDGNYTFESGSSKMSQTFRNGLASREFVGLADEILRRNSNGKSGVDTLEIIGHTDAVPVNRSGSFDRDFLERGVVPDLIAPGSNVDLGLLRAFAVRDEWNRFASLHREALVLKRVVVRCYSAGATIPARAEAVVSDPRKGDGQSRRIEARLTKLAR